MALIKCKECGSNISSMAVACPICGCPAELQSKHTEDNEKDLYIDPLNERYMADIDMWKEVHQLVNNNKLLDAIKAAKNITGTEKLTTARDIVNKIKEDNELPIDLILKSYEVQCRTVSTSGPSTMNEWESVRDLLQSGNSYRAVKRIQSLTGASIEVAGEIAKKIQNTGEIPVAYITMLFPKEGAKIKPESKTKPCPACNKTISVKAETCPHCGQPTGVHVCPRCGSTDVVYIDAVSKAASVALFGIFSVNTVRNKYECCACKMKF